MIHTVKANGANIPAIGLGTWDLRDETCERRIVDALAMGYRHIDTAAMYDNEVAVGNGIRASDVSRDEVFLTTKVWHDCAGDGPFQRSVEASLQRLDLDYVDLVLMHWPDPGTPIEETMRALADVKRRGLSRHIGVSNFTVDLLKDAVRHSSEPVAVNQVEYHPFLDQSAVLAECTRHGVALTAYSPLAKGQVFSDPVIGEIARTHGKNAGQIGLRWLVQQEGVIAIPRSSRTERIAEFIAIDDFTLTDDEMRRITSLGSAAGRLVDFDFAPRWD